MRNVMFMMAELNDAEVDWFVSAGGKETIRAGSVLIRQGEPAPSLYLVLKGEFSVTTAGIDRVRGRIGQGELIGEVSFLDSRPPMATVSAAEDSIVLAIPRTKLRSKLKTDTGFASRFYLALGIMLAYRLRDGSLKSAAKAKNPGAESSSSRDLNDGVEQAGEFSAELLDKVDSAARRFQTLLAKVGPI